MSHPHRIADQTIKPSLINGMRVMLSNIIPSRTDLQVYRDRAEQLMEAEGATNRNPEGNIKYSLLDMHDKVVAPKSGLQIDAHIFLPIPKGRNHANVKKDLAAEIFRASSLFVGLQTGDPALTLRPGLDNSPPKPILMVNNGTDENGIHSWQPFYDLAVKLYEQGTIGDYKKQERSPDQYVHMAASVDDAFDKLKELITKDHTDQPLIHKTIKHPWTKEEILGLQRDPEAKRKPNFNVCVFCSAGTRDPALIEMSRKLGRDIARKGWGLISGMGRTGMMGGVIEGATEEILLQEETGSQKRGWIGGSNVMRILNLEGPPATDPYNPKDRPKLCDKMWIDKDIYVRMNTMIDNSDSFLIMPGGMGSVQEFMALMLLKHKVIESDNKFGQMHKKPVIIVNPVLTSYKGEPYAASGKRPKRFWDGLIALAESYGFEQKEDFIVADSVEHAMDILNHRAPDLVDWKKKEGLLPQETSLAEQVRERRALLANSKDASSITLR